jgi:hypothetical protein
MKRFISITENFLPDEINRTLHQFEELCTKEQLLEEQKAMKDFGTERSTLDKKKPHGNGRRYFDGKDIYNNIFPDHQKRVR